MYVEERQDDGTTAAAADVAEGPAASEAPAPDQGRHLLELWSDRDEIHVLPEILRPSEGIVAVGSGTVLRSGRLAHPRWLVVLTDERLLCIKGRVEATRKVIDMPISACRSVEKKGLWRKTLVLDTSYGTLRITGLKGQTAAEITEGLAALMRAFRQADEPQVTALRRAELPVADGGSSDGEAVAAANDAIARIQEEMAALVERVTALESRVSAIAGG